MSKEKRQRSENWLEEDKIILQDLVRDRVLVLENKNTDANTNKKKIEAWNDLLNIFNGICVGATRNLSQVKAQWSLIKMAAKKKNFANKQNLIKTGGGAAPPTTSPSGDDIEVWLANEFVTDTNCYDSDTIHANQQGADLAKITALPGVVEVAAEGDIIELVEEDGFNEDNKSDIAKPGPSRKIIKSKRPQKQTNPAIQIAENEIQCRREVHMMQMELARQQIANEEHRSRLLHLEEKLLNAKLEYLKNNNNE